MKLKSCILLTSDVQNIRHAEFVAWQLKSPDTPEIFIGVGEDFHLAQDHSLANLFQINGCDAFDTLPSSERLKRFTYWRIPAIDQLAKTYDRILYLDTDLVISAESALTLLSIDLHDMKIAAIRDVRQSIRADREIAEFTAVGLKNAAYFNAGVLIIDGKKWRESRALEQILDIGRKNPEAMMTHDQSLLNIYAYENWLEISPAWNWQVSSRNIYLIEKFNAQVLHLAGENKVWLSTPKPKHIFKHRDKYKKFLKDVYQEDLKPAKELPPSLRAHLWLKSLYYKNKYKHWCNKFPNPLHGIVRDCSN
jgi:lipopolysaccharide biosynthesis glycosyltransferase